MVYIIELKILSLMYNLQDIEKSVLSLHTCVGRFVLHIYLFFFAYIVRKRDVEAQHVS